MKKLAIFATLIIVALTAIALAQGNQGKGRGNSNGRQGGQGQHQGQQHQANYQNQTGQQGQGNGNGRQGIQGQQGQGNGQNQAGGQKGQGYGMSCTMTSEVSTALYEALVSGEGEYAAYATYGAAIDKFGQVEPYVSIQQAEANHIDALKRQMDKYGISYPQENPYIGNVVAPDSLEEAAEAWAIGEIANVELYDRLLEASEDCSDVTRVFTNLRNASQEMHLPAFELAAKSGGTLSQEQMQPLSSEHHNGGNGDCENQGNQQNRGQDKAQNQGKMGRGHQGNNRQGQYRVADTMAEFNEHDLDGNGLISKEEFFNTKTANMTQRAQEGRDMGNAANAPTFEDLDTNGDDNISMEEFTAHLSEHQGQNQRQR